MFGVDFKFLPLAGKDPDCKRQQVRAHEPCLHSSALSTLRLGC